MPTNITLKGIPDNVYDRLKVSAEANRRSVSSEVIACPGALLLPKKTTALQHLAAVQPVRARLPMDALENDDVDHLMRKGRP
ncbi:MAG: Arc family DNA-binding protein [Aquabacterium sp.]|nr:Arc family DNA-binding protein [Aquabacterium sp.]